MWNVSYQSNLNQEENKMTNPIVKTNMPNLYESYTGHMTKAMIHSYNYASIDDALRINYENGFPKTLKQIAEDNNEYYNRVVYRYQVLRKAKVIVGARDVKFAQEELTRVQKQRQVLSRTARMVKSMTKTTF